MTLVRMRYTDRRKPGRIYGKEESEKQDLSREKDLQRCLLFDFFFTQNNTVELLLISGFSNG